MIESRTLSADDPEVEIATLVRTLHETQQRLQELAGYEVDAVIHPGGHSYLLHEAQENLRRSEKLHRELAATQSSILNALPAHIALLDHTGVIISVNEGWREFAESNGFDSSTSGLGENYLEVCTQAHGDCAGDAHAAAAGIRSILCDATQSFSLDYPCHSPSKQHWFRLRATPLEHQGPRGAVVMHMDITESKLAEEALRESESRFRGTFEQAAVGIAHASPEGRFLRVNDKLCAIVGYPREELLDMSYADLTMPEDLARSHAGRLALLTGEQASFTTEKRYRRKDGTLVWTNLVATVERSVTGEPNYLISVFEDITARKELELHFLRAQRMESIGTLAGGIAHDLNNSLTPIIMSLDLLKMRFADPKSRELLEIVSTSAQRGADMVRQVLSFGRGVEGERHEVKISHLVRDIEKISNDTFLKHIEVRTNIPHDLWTVVGDATQLHQVLLNLCVNARDAMPSGGRLTVSAENLALDPQYVAVNPDAHPGSYVMLQVEDTGTGIPTAIIEKIFDPFFTTKEFGKGTGLGLSTSLAIVKSHEGFLRVHSEPGKGTAFKIYLPARIKSSAGTTTDKAVELLRGNGELILVIDDESLVRRVTQQTLEIFGYRVVLAAEGAEAVALYATRRAEIAVVLTDMMMPIMDGAATIQVLRKLNPRLPIIAVTGLASNDHMAKFANLGINHFLPKPYTAETLLKLLSQLLGKSNP